MICAWKELLAVIPLWMREEVNEQGAKSLQELRLRINAPPELVFSEESRWLSRVITSEDLNYVVNTASRYSPWAAATITKGYITILGGHRIGICGEVIIKQNTITGIKNISSLCIRIARDFTEISSEITTVKSSVLILGPPGWGKTTLLRDLIRKIGQTEQVCVVDERGELFPEGFSRGKQIDVLSGCSKQNGIPMLLRTMGPSCIAVDEITEHEDTTSLLQAANCGVRLLATAHAISVADLQKRCIYRPLLDNRIFDVIVVLHRDKSYTMERMSEWVTNGSVQY